MSAPDSFEERRTTIEIATDGEMSLRALGRRMSTVSQNGLPTDNETLLKALGRRMSTTVSRTGPPIPEESDFTVWQALLFALAACVSAANVYWNQPILPEIAVAFNVTEGNAGAVATLTQIGYATGLLLVSPLGDMMQRHILVPLLCFVCVLISLGLAWVQNFAVFQILSFFLGMMTVIPQVLIPLAADMTRPQRRGRVIGIIMCGLLLGVLGARVISGVIAHYWPWQTVFLLAAVLMGTSGLILFFVMPRPKRSGTARMKYFPLLISLGTLVRVQPVLRQSAFVGAISFASFSLFWTTSSFHLVKAPFEFGSLEMGLFGIIGVFGSLAAPFAGLIGERKGPYLCVIFGLLMIILSFILTAVFPLSLPVMVVTGFLIDVGHQFQQVNNHVRIYALVPDARTRLNSVYMVSSFAGAAAGSSVGSQVYERYGWTVTSCVALCFGSFGLVAMLLRTPKQKGSWPGWMHRTTGGVEWKGVDGLDQLDELVIMRDNELDEEE